MQAKKLTRSQLNTLKLQLMEKAKVCPLTLKPFSEMSTSDVVVDHDHITGQIRGVLSRGANGMEGKVANAVGRWGGTGMDYAKIIPMLERLVEYLKREPLPYIYPTHLSEAEKKQKAGNARLQAAQARARARQKQALERKA